MTTQQKQRGMYLAVCSIILISIGGYLFIKSILREEHTTLFVCSDNKTITATFYPKEDTYVIVSLSDGRTLSLPHVLSGSGARYASTDEAFVFWNKGTTAFITEGTSTTYVDCVTEPDEPATTSPVVGGTPIKSNPIINDTLSGYANSEYNFTMRFPKYIQTRNDFTTFYTLPSNWRLNAAANNQGKAIVSFPIFKVDQGGIATGKAYPLFFTSEVRVGVSPNIEHCYDTDAGYTSQKVTNVTINGITFKRFSSEDAGMMKYTQAESYRTIHNKTCYVLEQVKSGSSYRDETMTAGISDATLTKYYSIGESIIQTFKFTK